MKFKLSEIGDIVTGATPKKSLKNAFGTFIPFLTPVDYKNSRTSNVTIRGLSEVGLNALKTRQLSANSISVTSIGSDMGKTQFNEKPLVTNQQINSIHNIKSEFSPLYVYYKLLSLHDYIYHIGSGNGSTMPILNKSDFSNIEIEVPEKSVQESIVSVLDPIDSWIETATVINDNLVELAIAMFKEMFPHIQYGDNQIGDYITPKRGKNLTSKNAVIGKIPVIAGGLSPATWHNQANTKKPVITISASGANAGFVNLWTIPVWSSDSSYIDSTMTDTPYFWYIMLKVRQSEIFDLQTGSAQPHIYPKHIAGLPTIKLTLANMKKYENRVIPIFDEYANNLSEINTLSNLRDTLLPKLLNGEIEFN